MAKQSKLILPNVSLNIIFLLCMNWDDTSVHFQIMFYLFDCKFEAVTSDITCFQRTRMRASRVVWQVLAKIIYSKMTNHFAVKSDQQLSLVP